MLKIYKKTLCLSVELGVLIASLTENWPLTLTVMARKDAFIAKLWDVNANYELFI